MPDAAELLKHDHRKVEALFERFQAGDRRTLEQICEELTIHTAVEEQVLYPVLPQISGGEEMRREAETEHDEVKEAVERLRTLDSGSEEVDLVMETIISGVNHHVDEEEQKVLPAMQSQLGQERMEQLGEQVLVAKREKLAAVGALGSQTKDELYKMAQVADLPGRSDMTKDQLVDALRT